MKSNFSPLSWSFPLDFCSVYDSIHSSKWHRNKRIRRNANIIFNILLVYGIYINSNILLADIAMAFPFFAAMANYHIWSDANQPCIALHIFYGFFFLCLFFFDSFAHLTHVSHACACICDTLQINLWHKI